MGKKYADLFKAYNNSYKSSLQTVVSQELADLFLNAASAGNIALMRELLTSKKITVKSVSNSTYSYAFFSKYTFFGRRLSSELAYRPVVDLALHRLGNNLPGLRMLLEEFEVPLPPDFLEHAANGEVARYLMDFHGLDPYEQARKEKKRFDDGGCPYFSAENIKRLCVAGKYRSLRPGDYEVIGSTLNRLANVLITKVKSGMGYKLAADGKILNAAPQFLCASPEDAIALKNFLTNECGLSFYDTVFPGSRQVFSREWLPPNICDSSSFIIAVARKAGTYQELVEEKNQCCGIM